MEALGCIESLKMALNGNGDSTVLTLIHHSDGGVQYGSYRYIEILSEHKIKISMAKSPYENAIAERINDTVKNEFGVIPIYKSYRSAKLDILKIVAIFNQKRPHGRIDYLTPDQAHQKEDPKGRDIAADPVRGPFDFHRDRQSGGKFRHGLGHSQ